MKTAYHHEEDGFLAVVDLFDASDLIEQKCPNSIYVVSRVNTPKAIRGRGLARKLLTKMTTDADASNTVLMLDPSPYPGTDEKRLIGLYQQFGFHFQKDGSMLRQPEVSSSEHLLSAQGS